MLDITIDGVDSPLTVTRGNKTIQRTWSGDGGDPPVQGERTAGSDVVVAGDTGSESLEIFANRYVGTAPMSVAFWSEASGYGTQDDLYGVRRKWTFDDPGYYDQIDKPDLLHDRVYDDGGVTKIVRGPAVFAADGETFLGFSQRVDNGDGAMVFAPNDTAVFLGYDKNLAYGPYCVHVFENPGTYVVNCATNKRGGSTVSESLTIVVEDAATAAWDWDVTVCIHPTGDTENAADPAWADAPAGAVFANTWAEAVVMSLGPSTQFLFYAGPGVTHVGLLWSGPKPDRGSGFARLKIGKYGPSKLADVSGNMAFDADTRGRPNSEWIMTGIRQRNIYDPATPAFPIGTSCVVATSATYYTVWDCDLGFCDSVFSSVSDVPNFIVGNTRMHSWRNFGWLAGNQAGNCGWCGVSAIQHPLTVVNPGSEQDEYADHSVFRASSSYGTFCMNLVYGTSQNDWSGWGYQPVLRSIRSAHYIDGLPVMSDLYFERVYGENGVLIGSGRNNKGLLYPRRIVYDKCYSLKSNQGGGFSGAMTSPASGFRVVNSVVIYYDASSIGPAPGYWLDFRAQPLEGESPNSFYVAVHELIAEYGIDVFNCTLVNQRTTTTVNYPDRSLALGMSETELYAYVKFANNVEWAPNEAVPKTAAAPLDLTQALTPKNVGRVTLSGLQPEYATPPSNCATYAPEPTSPIIGTADDLLKIAYDDFFGLTRPLIGATPGAFEPNFTEQNV